LLGIEKRLAVCKIHIFHAESNRLIDAFRLSLFGVILLSLSYGNSANCRSRTSRKLSVSHSFMNEYVPKLSNCKEVDGEVADY